jgi:2-polyprenylphenol 6-hydroxylase
MSNAAAELQVVIVGAGPVGLAIAALLATGPAAARLRLRVIDSQPPPVWNPAATDLRVYALSRAAQRIFAELGQWDWICARRASPYRRMRVWEGAHDGAASIDFDSADIGEPDLGHIVEDSVLRDALIQRIADRVELSFGTAVSAVAPVRGGMRVTLGTGETLSATLVVAADGGASRVRTLLEMPVIERNYGQQAIVTHVVTEHPHAATAWQRFLPDGPLAFLPLADGRSSVVWSMPSARARALLGCADAAFLDALQTAAGGVLGVLGPIASRAAFTLTALHALEYCRGGIVLAGDAAHCVHPLAGQGMNLGLLDAACLAEELTRAVLNGEHIGDERVLQRYARRRKGDNLKMLLAFDALDRWFRLPPAFAPLRALGLSAVDRALPLKRVLMQRALGLAAGRRREQYASSHGLTP